VCALICIFLACLVCILCALRWSILYTRFSTEFIENSYIYPFLPSSTTRVQSYYSSFVSVQRPIFTFTGLLLVEKTWEFWRMLLVLHDLICFIYGPSFCLEQTLGPRIGYLPLLIPVIRAHFSNALPPGVDTVWFEYKGLPLKW
jgi:hypothetical protein